MDKENVTKRTSIIISFPRIIPWKLADDESTNKGSNSVLTYLLDSVSKNKINLQNYRNVNKVATMLRSQRVIVTEDAACPTLYFSDLAATEKDLFDYLTQVVPNGVKSIYYSIPKVSMNDIQSEISSLNLTDSNLLRQAYVVIQFKNTATAIRALLNMAASDDPKFESFASFGPPKECDNTGVIGSASRSLIEVIYK